MFQITVLALTVLINLVLGLFVYLKNPRAVTNRYFFTLTGAFAIWSMVNYLSVHPAFFSQLIWIRLTLSSGALLNLAVFAAFLAFPATSLTAKLNARLRLAILSTFFVMVLTVTPFVFRDLKIDGTHVSPIPAPGIALFLLQTLVLLTACVVTVVKKYRLSTGVMREQLLMVLLGVASTFSLIIISNFLLVVVFHITALIPLGPFFTLLFTGSFAYAIIRHKLFDIRAAVTRSVGYLMVIISITLVYGIGLFGVIDVLFRGSDKEFLRQVLSVILITPLAIQFQRTKQFLDRVSSRLFYRDAYDTQHFLDEFNNVLVSTYELEPLLKQCAEIIQNTLKPTYCLFSLRETELTKHRIVGTSNVPTFSRDDITIARSLTAKLKQKLIVTDLLDDSQKKLRQIMQKNDVAIICLMSASRTDSVAGSLVLGPKKKW